MALKIAGEKLIASPGLLAADVQISLHTAAPADDNELDYAGYARQTVAPAGWTVDAATGNPPTWPTSIFRARLRMSLTCQPM